MSEVITFICIGNIFQGDITKGISIKCIHCGKTVIPPNTIEEKIKQEIFFVEGVYFGHFVLNWLIRSKEER